MGRRLPPLNALRVFDIAARTRSFTAAAQELHVSQGAVSRHVAQLEAYLGTTLFHRQPGGTQLTAAGSDYARTIGEAFDQVEQATESVRATVRRRPLRIRLFPSLAIRWLITRLAEFHASYPALQVSIATSHTFMPFDPAEDDFTIQIRHAPQFGVRIDKLMTIELLPVCSADYLRRMPLATTEDLLNHALLYSEQRPDDWLLWFRAAGIAVDRVGHIAEGRVGHIAEGRVGHIAEGRVGHSVQSGPRFGMAFGNSALAYQAAIDGMGVAIAQHELVRDDLASGRLVAASPRTAPTGEAYYLASAAGEAGYRDIAIFRDWILSKGNIGRRAPVRYAAPLG